MVINTTADPSVYITRVYSTLEDGTYGVGEEIPVVVVFSAPVRSVIGLCISSYIRIRSDRNEVKEKQAVRTGQQYGFSIRSTKLLPGTTLCVRPTSTVANRLRFNKLPCISCML